MKKIVCICIFLFAAYTSMCEDTLRSYTITRASCQVRIDGILDEDCWKNANVADNFIQYFPDEKKPSTQKSEVRLLYDDQAIYIAGMFYDTAPDSTLRQLGIRDDYTLSTDVFKIGFDTYNNQQDAFIFEVTAGGVQRDVRSSDETYDAVWYSKVRFVNNGWIVEIKIPYSALRFPTSSKQIWGFQLARTVERRKEYDQWAYVPKGVNSVLNYWGKLKGLDNINAPVRLSMTPFAGTGYEKAPIDGSNYSESTLYNFGADLKYGFDEKFTLDLTLMPDFSQVQSDNKVKNLSYNEVTYNENRQFFKEGTELFNKGGLFYTRRIGKTPSGYYSVSDSLHEGEKLIENPSTARLLNAFKISGRNNNGLGVGFLNAITGNAFAIAEDSLGNKRKILSEPLTNYNIVVFDQQLKNNSSVYFINTNVVRDQGWCDANVTGSGITLLNEKKTYGVDASVTLSQIFIPTGIHKNILYDQTGLSYFAGIRKASGGFQWGLSHTYTGETFDTRDIGYYTIGNRTRERAYVLFNILSPKKWCQESYNSLILDYMYHPITGKRIAANINLNLYATLKNYWGIYSGGYLTPITTFNYWEPRVPGLFSIDYPNYFLWLGCQTDQRKKIMIDIMGEYGDFLKYYKGEHIGGTATIRYRANNRLQFKYSSTYTDDAYNLGFATFSDDGNIVYGGRSLQTNINSISAKYIIRYGMSVSIDGRHYRNIGIYKHYYDLKEDGFLSENTEYDQNLSFNYNAFYIDFLYSWEFAPGSKLTLSYKNLIETENSLTGLDFMSNFDKTLSSPQTNMVSLKLLYYLDYNSLKRKSSSYTQYNNTNSK
ncbi:MAG: DUF5916 domain-containing protein [Bacteroidota bacterium]